MGKKVKLIEVIRTWQGEGVSRGIPMLLCRFKTCNLKCYFCDTLVKMRISKEAEHDIEDLQKEMDRNKLSLMITGGEPTVPKHFDETVTLLNELNYTVANVESNGFKLYELIGEVKPTKSVIFIYSPKIFEEEDIESAKETLNKIAGHHSVHVKVVWDGSPYVEEFLSWLTKQEDLIEQHRVWLMPQGATRAELIKNSEVVFDLCEKYIFSFSSRDHLIFGFV